MEKVELVIKNEKNANYRVITAIAFITHILFFTFFLIYPQWFLSALGALLSVIGYSIVRWRLKKQQKSKYFIDSNGFLFFICAFWWIFLQKFLAVAICIGLGLMYSLAMKKTRFIFTPSNVCVFSPFKKLYSWQALINVVLKDGFLTLDFSNNKLIQAHIEEGTAINEADVNRFFSEQLQKKHNR